MLDAANQDLSELRQKLNFVAECLATDNFDPLLNINGRLFPLGKRPMHAADLPHKQLVFSTYFFSEADPQRNTFAQGNDHNFMQPLYESVKKQGLGCIIFHDGLSAAFVEKYTTPSIKFVRTELGPLSLNDERFLIYYEYLLRFGQHIEQLVLTDVSDVYLTGDPFHLLAQRPDHLHTGFIDIHRFKYSYVNYRRIERFEQDSGIAVPASYYNMRIFSAGNLGGSKRVVIYMLRQMIGCFSAYSTRGNHNMTVFNYCIFRYWLEAPKLGPIRFRSLRLAWLKAAMLAEVKLGMDILPPRWRTDNSNYLTDCIFAGFPFVSAFKKFEMDSKAYLIHK